MNIKNSLWLLLLSCIFSSCASSLDVDTKYILSQEAFKDSLKQKDRTLVLFWTNWCGASQQRITELYLPLMDSIRKNNLDLKLILLAADEKVPIEAIEAHRSRGISSFYIAKPGGNAILNRNFIKGFINDAFPDNEMEHISKFQFGIPVQLMINKDLVFLNEKDDNISYKYITSILQSKK